MSPGSIALRGAVGSDQYQMPRLSPGRACSRFGRHGSPFDSILWWDRLTCEAPPLKAGSGKYRVPTVELAISPHGTSAAAVPAASYSPSSAAQNEARRSPVLTLYFAPAPQDAGDRAGVRCVLVCLMIALIWSAPAFRRRADHARLRAVRRGIQGEIRLRRRRVASA